MKLALYTLVIILSLHGYSQNNFLIITGTYTSDSSKGIYVHRYIASQNKVEELNITDAINPSFISLSPGQNLLFSVNVKGAQDGTGRISSFTFNRKTGAVGFISTQPSPGNNPCYITVHRSGKWVVVGNYDNGTVAVYPVDEYGKLSAAVSTIHHTGRSVDTVRQTEPHVHSTVFSPDGKYLYVPDLGIDKIMIYNFNEISGQLMANKNVYAPVKAGNGPRHLTFDPSGKFAYLAEELSGSVTAFKYHRKTGAFTAIQQIATTPANFEGVVASADIHLSPDGKFLYVSNRGQSNTLGILSVHKKSGKLKLIANPSVMGKTPRNFAISDDGFFLLVANQNSDEIVIFKREIKSGLLTDTGTRIHISKPVCIKLFP